jgi:alpha-beta hydrolase superfamily lysophospholipase
MISETPVFFGGAHTLAGWFVRGDAQAGMRRCAVLLCPPIGHEYMCSYPAFRRLARSLAGMGFSVLRFDYYGTGDSAGPADEQSLVPVWLDNISSAIDELRSRSGCPSVSVIGLRFGATLACTATSHRDDVSSLVLWSPCVRGRSLIRQTRMLAMAAAARPGDLVTDAEGVESVGFFLNAATVAEITRMSLCDETAHSVESVLILTRDDGPAENDLMSVLTSHGVDCAEKQYRSYATFMMPPQLSVLPLDAMGAIGQWLDEKYPATASETDSAAAKVAATSTTILADGIRESAVSFGGLTGVLVQPASASVNPAVVLLNSGGYHHVGPHRLYVPLARQWAALGFSVLRLDLSGLGDSESRDDVPMNEPYPPSALQDIRDAIAYTRDRVSCDNVILAGMCSGAYHAVHAADPAICGVIAVNPPLFHRAGDPIVADPYYNNDAETRRVARALFSAAKWRRLISGRVDLRYTFKVVSRRAVDAASGIAKRGKQLLRREGASRTDPVTLFRDGVAMHLIFNVGDKSQVFFDRELAGRLRRTRTQDDLTVDMVDGADHTFMPVRWQRTLAQLMTDRLVQHRAMGWPGQRSQQPDASARLS